MITVDDLNDAAVKIKVPKIIDFIKHTDPLVTRVRAKQTCATCNLDALKGAE